MSPGGLYFWEEARKAPPESFHALSVIIRDFKRVRPGSDAPGPRDIIGGPFHPIPLIFGALSAQTLARTQVHLRLLPDDAGLSLSLSLSLPAVPLANLAVKPRDFGLESGRTE